MKGVGFHPTYGTSPVTINKDHAVPRHIPVEISPSARQTCRRRSTTLKTREQLPKQHPKSCLKSKKHLISATSLKTESESSGKLANDPAIETFRLFQPGSWIYLVIHGTDGMHVTLSGYPPSLVLASLSYYAQRRLASTVEGIKQLAIFFYFSIISQDNLEDKTDSNRLANAVAIFLFHYFI